MFVKLNNLKTLASEYQVALKKDAKKAMQEAFSELFEKHTTLKGLRWEQFAPSFNDGAPCVFSVHELYFLIEGVKVDEEEAEDYEEDEDGNMYLDQYGLPDDFQNETLMEDVNSLFGSDSDIFMAAFGDYARITATREGFEVHEPENTY